MAGDPGSEAGVSTVLALDLGTNLGWCMRQADGRFISGVTKLEKLKHRGEGFQFLRFRQFLVQADQHLGGITDLVYEKKTFVARGKGPNGGAQGFKAAELYGAWWGVLTGWCEYKQIRYHPVAVQTMKKSAAGHGHAKKWQVAEACEAYWPEWKPKSEDEADARGLMLHFLRVIEVPRKDPLSSCTPGKPFSERPRQSVLPLADSA